MIRPLDIARLREQFRNATPFPSMCIDNFLEPDAALEIARSYPSYQEASGQGREFDAVNEKQKVQITDAHKFPPAVARLAQELSSEAFRSALSEISGIKNLGWDAGFNGGGMHLTAKSGRLDVHIDFNRLESTGEYRRLNILVFLNETWEPAWGGQLELWDADVKVCHHSLLPVLNRCVIFETSETSYHGVRPVTCPPGVARLSFAAYYYTKEVPLGAPAHSHSTVFKARPDEKLRKYVLMPGERVGREGYRLLRRVAGRALREVRARLPGR